MKKEQTQEQINKKELYVDILKNTKSFKSKINGELCLLWLLEDGLYIKFKNKNEFLIPYNKIVEVLKPNESIDNRSRVVRLFVPRKKLRTPIMILVLLAALFFPIDLTLTTAIFKLSLIGLIGFGLYKELFDKNSLMVKISTNDKFDYNYLQISYISEEFYSLFNKKCNENGIGFISKVKNIFKSEKK